MPDIVHELSWSSSRSATFELCRRRYYHDYYQSWTGWSPTAPPLRRKAYLLKKMTRMPMLAGDVLHRALERYFQGMQQGAVETEESLVNWAVTALREGYKESRDGKWKRSPSKLTHLAEHHYEEACVDERTGAAGAYGKRYVERIRVGLATFFHAAELAEVRAVEPKDFLGCEELGSFEYEGTKVFAVPDFAFQRSGGAIHVYDWKTGQARTDDRFQLAVYALYAEARWGAEPSSVVCTDAYLSSGEVTVVRFDEEEIAEARQRIDGSLASMREVHFNADREEGDPDLFRQIPEGSEEARECTFCNYRELCDR